MILQIQHETPLTWKCRFPISISIRQVREVSIVSTEDGTQICLSDSHPKNAPLSISPRCEPDSNLMRSNRPEESRIVANGHPSLARNPIERSSFGQEIRPIPEYRSTSVKYKLQMCRVRVAASLNRLQRSQFRGISHLSRNLLIKR
jgi:hypothetical protein